MSTSANERRLVQPLAPVLSAEEVTDLLGLSPPTLRRLVKDGHLRAHRLPGGRKWVFRADEVLESVGSWPADDEEDQAVAEQSPAEVAELVDQLPTEPAPVDVTAIWCPAPVDDGESHSQRCAQAWIDAARRAGVQPTLMEASRVEVAGDTYELRVGPRDRVLVIDDDGEEAWQLIDAVWVERPAG